MSFANPHHAQNPALRQAAKQGLRPYPFELQPGMVLYRYIDVKKSTPEVASDGPWWFEYESFQRIKHFAQRNGYAHSYAARLFGAILFEWSEVSAYVEAEVKVPLKVWKGPGKQVDASSSKDERDRNPAAHGIITGDGQISSMMTPMQGPLAVYQIYIPGLGKPYNQFAGYMKLLRCTCI